MVSVISHVLSRLYDIGVSDIFGVPGDYAFAVNDAICAYPGMRWIGCCNELNAGYAADGYARIKGLSALCTTYGVGELGALPAIAGSYAERLPIFHLVGTPSTEVQASRALIHHSLGNGEFDLFHRMAEPVSCARAIMTPETCVAETERVISAALYHRRPVYIALPANTCHENVIPHGSRSKTPKSDPKALKCAVDAVIAKLDRAKAACVLPGILLARIGLQEAARAIIDAGSLPFATMFTDKSVLDECHPNYIGMYDGKLANEEVRLFVEECDCILGLGAMLTDLNTGAFTAQLEMERTIDVMHHRVRVGYSLYERVEMDDLLNALAAVIKPRPEVRRPAASSFGKSQGSGSDPITAEALYPRLERFLKPGDTLLCDTGSLLMGLSFAKMAKGARFHNQALWAAIGWATPAAFGAALAAPNQRVILATGEGAHQVTAQELGQFYRYGLKPIVFVLNNNGYLIERLLGDNPESRYNDVAQWNYEALPQALGCHGWFTVRVTTCEELDRALHRANEMDSGAYIEIVTEKYVAPPLLLKINQNHMKLHQSNQQ